MQHEYIVVPASEAIAWNGPMSCRGTVSCTCKDYARASKPTEYTNTSRNLPSLLTYTCGTRYFYLLCSLAAYSSQASVCFLSPPLAHPSAASHQSFPMCETGRIFRGLTSCMLSAYQAYHRSMLLLDLASFCHQPSAIHLGSSS